MVIKDRLVLVPCYETDQVRTLTLQRRPLQQAAFTPQRQQQQQVLVTNLALEIHLEQLVAAKAVALERVRKIKRTRRRKSQASGMLCERRAAPFQLHGIKKPIKSFKKK